MAEDILRKLKTSIPNGQSVDLRVLWTVLNRAQNKTHSEDSRDAAIAGLVERGFLKQQGEGDSRRFSLGEVLVEAAAEKEHRATSATLSSQQDIPERSLMPFLRSWIEQDHCRRLFPVSSQNGKIKVVDTSAGGGRVGLWSRPDFTLAALQTGKYSNIRQIELAGYELKKAGAADLTSVHETLAHKRWVHRAFLILYAPPGFDDADTIIDLKLECGRYGLGLITFSRLNDNSSFVEHVPAERESIPPQLTEEFIESRMINDAAELRQWVEAG